LSFNKTHQLWQKKQQQQRITLEIDKGLEQQKHEINSNENGLS